MWKTTHMKRVSEEEFINFNFDGLNYYSEVVGFRPSFHIERFVDNDNKAMAVVCYNVSEDKSTFLISK